jgi:hypothetical protein
MSAVRQEPIRHWNRLGDQTVIRGMNRSTAPIAGTTEDPNPFSDPAPDGEPLPQDDPARQAPVEEPPKKQPQ